MSKKQRIKNRKWQATVFMSRHGAEFEQFCKNKFNQANRNGYRQHVTISLKRQLKKQVLLGI